MGGEMDAKEMKAAIEKKLTEFAVKDSGKRQEFKSGMVRDTSEGKTNYMRILDGPMLDRWAAHLTKAEAKYPDVAPGVPNWTLGTGAEELQRYKVSAFRHMLQWLRDELDEDHAAAVMFNINGAEYVKAQSTKLISGNITQTKTPFGPGEAIKLTCSPDTAPPRRAHLHEQTCSTPRGMSGVGVAHWTCEREAAHRGKHMAWKYFNAHEPYTGLYEGGEW